MLTAKSTVNLNHCNTDGYTPLHLACLSDKPECVTALLLAGADVNLSAKNISKIYKTSTPTSVAEFLKNNNSKKLYTQDMKYGGTPLHWCSSKETLQALIERGCDVNHTNFDGQTALHVMVSSRSCFHRQSITNLIFKNHGFKILDYQEEFRKLQIQCNKVRSI